jgi:hypothetical protein
MPYAALAATIANLIQKTDGDLLDALLVTGGLWSSYTCTDRRCCPADGRPIPTAPTPFAADATVAGLTVAPNREDLERRFEPDEQREQLRQLVEHHERALGPVVVNGQMGLRGRAVLRTITTAINTARGGSYIGLADADVARAGAALRHPAIRDAVWLEIDNRGGVGDELWLDLARQLPSPHDAAPLFLYGWSAWRQGNGTLAAMAAARALANDPSYSAAELLTSALQHGVDPRHLPQLGAANANPALARVSSVNGPVQIPHIPRHR